MATVLGSQRLHSIRIVEGPFACAAVHVEHCVRMKSRKNWQQDTSAEGIEASAARVLSLRDLVM